MAKATTGPAKDATVDVTIDSPGGTGASGGGAAPTGTTPPQYVTGWIKQDPETLAVAVRTNIPDPDSNYDWGVMTVDRGGHYAGWDEVSSWNDK